MNISIHEKNMFFGVGYDIATPTQVLQATKKTFSLLAHITLQASDDAVLSTITGESLIRAKFTIALRDGRNYDYHCEKMFKGVDVCEGDGGPYHLYSHKKRRFSIFQNDMQIAALSRELMVIGNAKQYEVLVNADANISLIISMILCLNTEDGNDQEDNSVTWDFGRIGFEDRPFDETWRPNDEKTA